LGVSGGGDTPESVVDALYCARNMEYRTGVKKYVILLTDANYKNGTSVDSGATLTDEIRRLVEEELVVSVVTTPSYYSTYNSLVSQTDGVTANINQNFASALAPLITKMGEQVNQGCWIRLSNGSVVSLDKDPTLGDETIDTDDDGIPDIIELKSSYKVHAYNPYTKENAGQLAKQVVFDENVAVQTAVTEHGIKYNQLISIVGANGKKIDVVFVWIKNNDGFVRLVTAIPTKK
jgi:hypothetical protein